MFAGHLATALLAKQQAPRGHIAYYLIASQLPDLIWLPLHFLGLEPTAPDNVMLVSLDTIRVDMTYSHDLLPVLGWIVVAALVGRVGFGRWRVGLVGGALVAAHSTIDNLAGYSHHLFGPDSVNVSTGMYQWSPYLAVGIEAAFVVAIMAWVTLADRLAGVRRTLATWVVRGVVFVGGVAFMLSVADLSLVEVTGIEPLAILSGSTMPVMVSMYVAMLIALGWSESRPERVPSVAELRDISTRPSVNTGQGQTWDARDHQTSYAYIAEGEISTKQVWTRVVDELRKYAHDDDGDGTMEGSTTYAYDRYLRPTRQEEDVDGDEVVDQITVTT